uniref:Interferon-induced transmembrane protein n=1 Tax=uncultured delta proteobacterium DeepAnt-1F12 TaxID=357894 RepID=Q2I6M2_9DELT|nr:conserved bacterial hypothetical protein [uncultured delta proteobacterium DeepAnt-1F12]
MDSGVLTPEEFEAQKANLLAGGSGPVPSPVAPSEPGGPMPPNYMVQAILATLFCCMPVGIVAIIKSSAVATAYNSQGYQAALTASEEAKKWVNIAVLGAFLVGALYFLLGLGGVLSL